MILSDSLKTLATLFPVPLYVVGGAVRDTLAGYTPHDIDLASALRPGEVFELLKNTGYSVCSTSEKLGTLKISRGRESYEYTAFRCDSYANDGTHVPMTVRFTSDIEEDARRRDFKLNAIYFDIKNGVYVDPLDGKTDIARKVVNTTRAAEEVFREDALRLIRAVRIACTMGYEISADVSRAIQKYASGLGSVAKERIFDELTKIIVCDTVNGVSGAHTRAIKLLISLGLMEYIIPELLEGDGVAQRPDYHKYDVLGHILAVFDACPPSVRMAALFHDIAKPKLKRETGKMVGHDVVGAAMAKEILHRFKCSNAYASRVARLTAAHMYDLRCDAGEGKVRLFVQKNDDILDDLIALKDADYVGSGLLSGRNPSGVRLERVRCEMRAANVPFHIKDLKVGGKELIAFNIPEAERGKVMQELLTSAANCDNLCTREGQLRFLENKAKYFNA